jgi:DNA-binding NtrC family response regulator
MNGNRVLLVIWHSANVEVKLARELTFFRLNSEKVMSERVMQGILVVDDEPDICFLFENILRKRNLRSGYAHNLADAASQLEKKQPALIFLDNSLPDGKGIDFIPFLKSRYPLVKVVIVTANDSPEDETAAYLKGADDFLGKPLSMECINRTLDKNVFRPMDSPVL